MSVEPGSARWQDLVQRALEARQGRLMGMESEDLAERVTQPLIGQMVIGEMEMDIESVEFIGGVMRVHCTLGTRRAGSLKGMAHITGTDGQVAWRGIRSHDLGTKTADVLMSVWEITFDADIMLDRSAFSVTTRYKPPLAGTGQRSSGWRYGMQT